MREIVVKASDSKAAEVHYNDSIAFKMGSNSKEYRALLKKEQKIAHRFLDIALTGRLPKLVKITFEKRKDISAERINDIQFVCQKVACLMAEGFHAKIIIEMLRCATGGGCQWSGDFQVKFEAAKTESVRKDFWGTKYSIPLVAAEDLLVDMLEREINVDTPTNDDLKKSWFMKEFLTNHEGAKSR